MSVTVTVMGATGKTGAAVTEGLLAAGIAVKAMARSADKLTALAKKGATPVAGDTADAAALEAALRGSEAVYALIPGDYTKPDLIGQYARFGRALAQAVRGAGVKRVALLSSLGADLPAKTGPIAGLHQVEEMLRAVPGIDLLLLRPGYFYENFYGSLALIKGQGLNGGVMKADVPVTMIASRDIGVVAAQALIKKDFSGVVVRELAGPRPLTMAEATRIVGGAIGKPDLAWVQFPPAGALEGMKGAGFSEDAARLFVEMSQAFNEGMINPQPGSERVKTPTTFEAFAKDFARAYGAS
jgi:uncharacterized protein YbjT (DUF2867 family)